MVEKINILNLNITKDFLSSLGGENAIKLVTICQKKRKKVTDEEIGKSMKNLKITEIRALLNRLHYKGIANYAKKRDSKSGWYHYTWDVKNTRIAELIIEEQKNHIEKLEQKIQFEEGHEFFTCKKNCDNVAFEIAAEYAFKCPKCSKEMDLIDTQSKIKKVKNQINSIKKEMEILRKVT